MIRPLRQSTDFERVLKTRSRASSAHFAVHHLAGTPARPRAVDPLAAVELSTGPGTEAESAVDGAPPAAAAAVWLGTVLPKRHARRAVTRTLLKRQIRNVVGDGVDALASGLWVVRLRAPFDRAQFTSAASDALRLRAREELRQLLAVAAERLQRR